MNDRIVSITTIDNPFDPIDDFDHWFLYDIEKGYYTCNKIARLTEEFDGMTQIEEEKAIEKAIDRLIEIDPLDIYKKIVKNDNENDEKSLKNDEKIEENNKKGTVDDEM